MISVAQASREAHGAVILKETVTTRDRDEMSLASIDSILVETQIVFPHYARLDDA
jgi:hypothetical protein